jgi:hypothetical protein
MSDDAIKSLTEIVEKLEAKCGEPDTGPGTNPKTKLYHERIKRARLDLQFGLDYPSDFSRDKLDKSLGALTHRMKIRVIEETIAKSIDDIARHEEGIAECRRRLAHLKEMHLDHLMKQLAILKLLGEGEP